MTINCRLLHPKVTVEDFIEQELKSYDKERELHNQNGSVKEVLFHENDGEISYNIHIDWSSKITVPLEKNIHISEKREFIKRGAAVLVQSNFQISGVALTVHIDRTIEKKGDDVHDVIDYQILYNGTMCHDSIITEFFLSFKKHIPASGPQVPRSMSDYSLSLLAENQSDDIYHVRHDALEDLEKIVKEFSKTVVNSRINRTDLVLPNMEQICRAIEIVDKSNFSIQNEINEMNAKVGQTLECIQNLKEARQHIAVPSALPLFILSSCAAIVFTLISRSK